MSDKKRESMDKKVSVIIPTYKRGVDILSRAITSLLEQTYQNLEIVLVDDNATEETIEYRKEVSDYVESLCCDKIIYIQNEENFGSAKSRNEGIFRATGEYVTFLDDDDKYLKDKVKNQVEFMVNNELDMSFTNIAILNQDNKVIDFREFRRIKDFSNEKLLQYHLTKKITPTDIYMVKTECIKSVGGFDTHGMGDELVLMTKLIESGIKMGYLDDTQVILYREGQASLTVGKNRLEEEKKVYVFIKQYFDKLTLRQRCYVRFRYNVMKIVTYKREGKIAKMLMSIIMAFLSDPISFFVEPVRMGKNLRDCRNMIVEKEV